MIDKGIVEATRLSTAQRNAISMSPTDTGIIYNSSVGAYQVWDGSAWVDVGREPLYAIYGASSQNPGVNGYVVWNATVPGAVSNGITIDGANQLISLPIGRTYEVELAWRIAGSGTTGFNTYQIWNHTNSQTLGSIGLSASLNTSTFDSNRPISRAIFNVNATRQIAARQGGGLGEFEGYMVIKTIG